MTAAGRARHQAEDELRNLKGLDRARIYAGGLRGTEAWLDKRALQILAGVPEDECMSRQSARALIADTQRWQRNYEKARDEVVRWLEWSGGSYPDTSPGDVIHWDADGTIVLDDGITTWNPLRALEAAKKEIDALREQFCAGLHAFHADAKDGDPCFCGETTW